MLRHVNQTLLAWAIRKYKRVRGHKIQANHCLQLLVRDSRGLFVCWRIGMTGTSA